MADSQEFCLKWNDHQSTLIKNFDTLLESEILVDCTLSAEGKYLKAHKVVLSACSSYFQEVLSENYDKHPIFILKDVTFKELKFLLDYMYKGEINISQDQLASFLKVTDSLQIKGFWDSQETVKSEKARKQTIGASAAGNEYKKIKKLQTSARTLNTESAFRENQSLVDLETITKTTTQDQETSDSAHDVGNFIDPSKASIEMMQMKQEYQDYDENNHDVILPDINKNNENQLEESEMVIYKDNDPLSNVPWNNLNQDSNNLDDNDSNHIPPAESSEDHNFNWKSRLIKKMSFKVVNNSSMKYKKCDICDKNFNNRRNYYRHKKYLCGNPKRFQCFYCPYRTNLRDNVYKHIRSRHKDMPLKLASNVE